MTDFGIVHLTDLHYPVRGAPKWRDPFMRAIAKIPDDTIEIRGIAVTGDLANSPSKSGFKTVARFLDDVAEVLKIPSLTRDARRERIWIVDGNHDYRALGNIRISRRGVTAGGFIHRLSTYVDDNVGLFVVGLNSCQTGQLARGGVSHKDLETIADSLSKQQPLLSAARYRIALIHHHLLPLPGQPAEHMGVFRRFSTKIFDPGFKLLKNGGVVTRYLLQGGFDLVLHGHEHQAFAASVSYLDLSGTRSLSVVGGVAAATGFQVIRFQERGGVSIERHSYLPTEGAVVPEPKMTLWSHAGWQKMEWERASRSAGWYDRLEVKHVLSAIGDVEEVDDIDEIYAGTAKTLEQIDRQVYVRPEHLGQCDIQNIEDKEERRSYEKHQLPLPNPRITYSLVLRPAARAYRSHRGFVVKTMLYNAFAVTSRDASLRNLSDRVERQSFSVTYPTSQVVYRFRFPPEYAPDGVRIEVTDSDRGGKIDQAETERASGRLLYERGLGTIMLDLAWVLPRHNYTILWIPPGFPARNDTSTIHAREQIYRLCMLDRASQAKLSADLRRLRDRICDTFLGCSSGDIEQLELGLWAFDQLHSNSLLKWVAGTHSPSSPFRAGTLPWGVGIQGWTMRRKNPLFIPTTDDRNPIYRPPSGCPRERSILSVPIPAPWDSATDENIAGDPALPCVVVTLSSLYEIPNMGRMENSDILKDVSVAILNSALDILISEALGLRQG